MKQKIHLDEQLSLDFYPSFLSSEQADFYYHQLLAEVDWHQEQIKMFGRSVTVPRLVGWQGDDGLNYVYSGRDHKTNGFSPSLAKLKSLIEAELGCDYNFVLLNHYRDGDDYMGWHQDNEKVLGRDPTIASLSLGAERDFLLRHKVSKEKRCVALNSGSLLDMRGDLGAWEHALPKRKKVKTGRINLTFRRLMTE